MKKHKQRMLVVILLVAVVFVVGVLIGNTWGSSERQDVSKVLNKAELSAESFLVEQELFASFETNCDLANERLSSLADELWNLGKILGAEDAQERLGTADYDFLKKKYHLMQIRTYILYKKLWNDCRKKNVILFYFSRDDGESQEQGRVLDKLVSMFDLTVFAIEFQYASEIKFLEDYYEVKAAPTIIVNFDHTFEGVAHEDQIMPLIYG